MVEAKKKIKEYIRLAKALIPDKLLPCAAPTQYSGYAPGRHSFEHEIWSIGEKIRQIMVEHKALRKDEELLKEIAEVSVNENAMHGRQSFIMLLGYKHCIDYENQLITQLNDYCVFGHIIDTLYKMGSVKYIDYIAPFTKCEVTWVRKVAIKYVERANNK